MGNKKQPLHSICQECFNFGCSWHESFKPVKGWKATPTLVYNRRNNGKTIYNAPMHSFKVIACPLYKDRDTRTRVKIGDIAKQLGLRDDRPIRKMLAKGQAVMVGNKRLAKEPMQSDGYAAYYLEEVKG